MNCRRASHLLLAVLCSCLPCTAVRAAEKTFDLVVDAGKCDRANAPVRTLIALPAELAGAKTATLTTEDGKKLAGQLTAPGLKASSAPAQPDATMRELHFILPRLEKGKTLKLTAAVSTAPAEGDTFVWKDTPGEYAELSYAGKPVLRYMDKALDESSKGTREQTYKVFHHLYDPAGTQMVTKGPGGMFTHHRGLFYGFNRITCSDGSKADTWHCGGDAYLSHEGFLAQEAGPVLGRHLVAVAWHGKGKQVFAKEQREMTVYRVPGGHLVEFASRLATTGGKVKLDGDPQHAGFQFRANVATAEKPKDPAAKAGKDNRGDTYYLRPDGKGKLRDTRNWPAQKAQTVNLPWNAMSFIVGQQRYTAVYLDNPGNPKEARYSERDYGRFGSYFEYELDQGKDLLVNYRLWLQDGEMTVEQAAALSADFVEPAGVTVK